MLAFFFSYSSHLVIQRNDRHSHAILLSEAVAIFFRIVSLCKVCAKIMYGAM